MAKVADISTKLSLNSRDFKKGLKATGRSMEKFHAAFKKAALNVAKAGAVAVAGGAAALITIVNKTGAAIDDVAKQSEKLGIPTEKLAALGHAAEQTGITTNNMTTGLQRMTRRIAEAGDGTGEAVKALDGLGIKIDDIVALSPDQQFLMIADAMENIKGQSDKVKLAFKLFDTEGVDLINTMQGGSAAVLKLMKDAENLGLTFTKEEAKMVEASRDAVDRMEKVFTGLFNSITIQLSPFIEEWANAMTEAALEGESMTDRVSAGIEKIVKVIGVLGNAVNLVKGTIQFAFGGIQLVIFGTLKGINESLIWIFGNLDKLLRGFQKVPGAKKLGIPAGLNPDLTHEQVMARMRGAASTEYIAQGMFDAKKNIAAGTKALVAGATGSFADDLLADYHETLRKAAERAAKIKEEHKAKKALRDANAAAEKAIAEATAAAAKAAAEDAAAAAEVAKAAKAKAAGAGLRLVDEVAQVIIEDIKQANVEGAKVAEQARRHIGDWRLGRKAKIGGFELDAPWDDPRGRWGQMVRAAEADAGAGADGGLNDPGQIKRDKVQIHQGKVLLQILTSLNNIRDSKFVSFAS